MKRMLALLLAMIMVISTLTACGDGAGETKSPAGNSGTLEEMTDEEILEAASKLLEGREVPQMRLFSPRI